MGDTLWSERVEWSLGSGKDIPDWVFVVAWAIALIATGLWALRRNRRWAVNTLTVFGAIHFYTQYFERMHATPSSLIVAGVLALCIALAIARYNREPKGIRPDRHRARPDLDVLRCSEAGSPSERGHEPDRGSATGAEPNTLLARP